MSNLEMDHSVLQVMRLLVYGDLQATDGNEVCWADPTITLQHYRVTKFYQDIADIYAKHKCDGVIDLGDTTDDRSSIPVPTIEAVGAGLDLIPDSNLNFKLVGNHEQFLRNTSINNRRLFQHKFEVVNQTDVYDFNGVTAVFCSYPAKHELLTDWLDKNERHWKSPKILFGHFQAVGCTLNSGTALDGIPKEALEPFDLCLLGHIHLPHTIGKTIHYVGSPFQQDWGEAGQVKRVAILDTEKLSIKWVPLAGYPEYRLVKWDEFKDLESIEEHRYRVALSSHAETEAFFQHAFFQKAEPVYDYDAIEPEKKPENQDWTFEGICQRYISLVPPAAIGADVTEKELLEIGTALAKGQL